MTNLDDAFEALLHPPFEIVPDSERGKSDPPPYRRGTPGANSNPAWVALLAGKTVKMFPAPTTKNFSRSARNRGRVLRSRLTPDGMVIMWLED